MAQDVRDSRLYPPESRLFLDDRLSEKPSVADAASTPSHTGTNNDARSLEPLRNGTLEPSTSNTRTPDDSVLNEHEEPYHGLTGKKLRTLPGT